MLNAKRFKYLQLQFICNLFGKLDIFEQFFHLKYDAFVTTSPRLGNLDESSPHKKK